MTLGFKPMVRTLALAVTVGLAACSSVPPSSSTVGLHVEMVTAFDHQATGVAVSESGRVFVSFPRWTEDSEISLAEVVGGRLVPYPDAAWNGWRNALKDEVDPRDHWVCVQAMAIDHGTMWVIDPAAPAMGNVVKGGPKLVQIDLATNRPLRTVSFDEQIAPQGSYLNDLRISPDARTIYMTDSGAKGALVVLDVASGKAMRILDGAPSTQPDKSVTVMYDGKPLRRPDGRGVEFAADGIALSRDGGTLYWQAIKGKTLYSVPTRALRDGVASPPVSVVGTNGPADGLVISQHDGRMYVTSPQDDSVKVRDLSAPGSAAVPYLHDARLRWPDTFAEGPDGTLYLTASRIQDSAFFKPDAPSALPTALWKIVPGGH